MSVGFGLLVDLACPLSPSLPKIDVLGDLVSVADEEVRLFLFERALLSAALIFFSSAELLTMLSLSYSLTVSHPPGDLSAILISLFLPLILSTHSLSFLSGLCFAPFSINSMVFSKVSCSSSLKENCFWFDLYLKSFSLFRFLKLLLLFFSSFSSHVIRLSRYFLIS